MLLQRRADPGLPLVSIALIGQRGQQAFAALASSGLVTPQDWEGRLVGYKGTPPPDLFALLAAAGADPARVELVNVGFDPRVLTEGQVDVYPVFKSNEPYLIQSWGYDLTLWDAADYGVPTLGLAYVTSEATLQAQPERLVRFLRAALRGIEYAQGQPRGSGPGGHAVRRSGDRPGAYALHAGERAGGCPVDRRLPATASAGRPRSSGPRWRRCWWKPAPCRPATPHWHLPQQSSSRQPPRSREAILFLVRPTSSQIICWTDRVIRDSSLHIGMAAWLILKACRQSARKTAGPAPSPAGIRRVPELILN